MLIKKCLIKRRDNYKHVAPSRDFSVSKLPRARAFRCNHLNKNNLSRCKRRVVHGYEGCYMHSPEAYNLVIAKSNYKYADKKGLFAWDGTRSKRILFKSGDVICKVNGEILHYEKLKRRYEYNLFQCHEVIQLSEECFEDCLTTRSFGSHAQIAENMDDCNARIVLDDEKRRCHIVADKDIANGEEIWCRRRLINNSWCGGFRIPSKPKAEEDEQDQRQYREERRCRQESAMKARVEFEMSEDLGQVKLDLLEEFDDY